MKDTKRKAGWNNPEVLKLMDNYILRKQPSKASKLILLLQPFFDADGIGRTTVIHHIKAREKELKNGTHTKLIHKELASETEVNIEDKQPFTEMEEVVTDCPRELLNKQIENIQQELSQPQTAEHSAALQDLLKRLTEAKQEFLKKISVFEEKGVPPVSASQVPRGKKRVENFYFGFNEKLTKNLLTVIEDESNVREFSLEKTHNETKYYTCCRCRNYHDRQKKQIKKELVKKCRAIILLSGEVFMDKFHDGRCERISKAVSDKQQEKRISRLHEANVEQLKSNERNKSNTNKIEAWNVDSISAVDAKCKQKLQSKEIVENDNNKFESKNETPVHNECDDDECQITTIKLHQSNESKVIKRQIIYNIQIQSPKRKLIPANLYSYVMPSSTNLTQSNLFIPPTLSQIQDYLEILELPLVLASDSPLLNSITVETEAKSMITLNIAEDGNCGFSSLSILFTGVEEYHWKIRLKIYDYIATNGHNIYGIKSAAVAKEYYKRFQELKNDNPHSVKEDLYAGNNDFYALADMLGCNIYTYTPNPVASYPHITPHFKDNKKADGAPTLFLLYLNRNHYEPIVDFK